MQPNDQQNVLTDQQVDELANDSRQYEVRLFQVAEVHTETFTVEAKDEQDALAQGRELIADKDLTNVEHRLEAIDVTPETPDEDQPQPGDVVSPSDPNAPSGTTAATPTEGTTSNDAVNTTGGNSGATGADQSTGAPTNEQATPDQTQAPQPDQAPAPDSGAVSGPGPVPAPDNQATPNGAQQPVQGAQNGA